MRCLTPGPIPAQEAAAARLRWLRVDQDRKEVWIDGKLVALSKKEFNLVLLLYHRMGSVCSRNEIIAEVWPEVEDPGAVSDASIDQLIHRLREKIEINPSKPRRIISRKAFGYMLASSA